MARQPQLPVRSSIRRTQKPKPKSDLSLEIAGVLLVLASALSYISLFVHKFGTGGDASRSAGFAGQFLARSVLFVVGDGWIFAPLLLGFVGVHLMIYRRGFGLSSRVMGLTILGIVFLAGRHFRFAPDVAWENARQGFGGGVIGYLSSLGLTTAFGTRGRVAILLAAIVVGLSLSTGKSLVGGLKGTAGGLFGVLRWLWSFVVDFTTVVESQKRTGADNANTDKRLARNQELPATAPVIHLDDGSTPAVHGEAAAGSQAAEKEPPSRPELRKERKLDALKPSAPEVQNPGDGKPERITGDSQPVYQVPPVSILDKHHKVKNLQAHRDIIERTRILEETLDSFGVKAKVTEVHQGPVITRYELQPAPGVKVSKITSLADDLALNLAAQEIRIEAPIPGKAAIGIEVPNREISPVTLREVLETPEFADSSSKLSIALGKDIAGRSVIGSLEKMPHLLIAGATGSGKSVCMNTIICSILFKARPDEVKFLMVDPKMVELQVYNGIPHLTAPVVTDPRKAAGFLKWAVKEMENRYELFASSGVRDIAKYNQLARAGSSGERPALPYVMVFIDELADLMMVAPVDVEDAICRLAQMARAAGIHLVVATQRPSVDVITGLIKANIPARISFAVSSQVDSRTILDMAGAEKLLGRGDMLYLPPGISKPTRAQGAFISEKEVEELVSFVKNQGRPEYAAEALEVEGETRNGERGEASGDSMFPRAVRVVIEHGQASVSILQRRLRVSYNRAARLIDDMEERGFIGPYQGSKPRDVLISLDDFARIFGPGAGDED